MYDATKVIQHPGLPAGEWFFLAFMFSRTNSQNEFTMYLDGNLVGSQTWTTGPQTGINQFYLANLEMPPNPDWFGRMTLDELMIFNRPLTQQEVQAIYNRFA